MSCASTRATSANSEKIAEIARRCQGPGGADPIGVNAGSLPDRKKLAGRQGEGGIPDVCPADGGRGPGHIKSSRSSASQDIKVKLKASDVLTDLAANRLFASFDNRYPLHLGLTESGPTKTGSIKSAMGIGILLAEGIGDTIRVCWWTSLRRRYGWPGRSWPTSRRSRPDPT